MRETDIELEKSVLQQLAERIRQLIEVQAYYNWEERTMRRISGDHLSDWVVAERYVRETYSYLFFQFPGHLLHKVKVAGGMVECPKCYLAQLIERRVQLQCRACGEVMEIVR